MGVIDYGATLRRQPVLTAARVAAGVFVLLCLAGLLGFAWLRFDISMERHWLALEPNPGAPHPYADCGASAWRVADDGQQVRDVWVRQPLFIARQQQVYDPIDEEVRKGIVRNARVEYRPAFWIVVAVAGLMLAANVAILFKLRPRNRIP
jgi:hypothetical protein